MDSAEHGKDGARSLDPLGLSRVRVAAIHGSPSKRPVSPFHIFVGCSTQIVKALQAANAASGVSLSAEIGDPCEITRYFPAEVDK